MAETEAPERVWISRTGNVVKMPAMQHPDYATEYVRADLAAAEREGLRELLRIFTIQELPDEMDPDSREHADYEGAYVIMVNKARAALGGGE